MDLEWDSQFDPENMIDTLETMVSETDDRLHDEMALAGRNIERDAKTRAPVDTGTLRSSIGHRVKKTGSEEITTQVGSDVKYAPFVEKGTKNMEAQPFLRPALDSEIRPLERRIRTLIMKVANDAGGV